MAILICSNELLKEPETWDLLYDFFSLVAVVKNVQHGTIFRVINDEVPMEDILIDLDVYAVGGIQPFVCNIHVYSLYKV